MKKVRVTYFKQSGKYYTDECELIDESLTSYEAMFEVLPKRHRLEEMFMLIEDGDDNKQPYIVPHLFKPIK